MAKIKRKKRRSPLRQMLSPRRLAIPVVIGLGLIVYLLVTEIDFSKLQEISWNPRIIGWLLLALAAAAFRDVGYMFRLRTLSEKKIKWRNIFDDIMLWEFSSSITPSVVGGSGIAIFILSKEKISVGRSTAIVMITAFLDELFYVVMVPLLLILVGTEQLFPDSAPSAYIFGVEWGVKQVFWVGYGFIIVLISAILFGIFISPRRTKMLIIRVFMIPFLRRWIRAAYKAGDDLITTSKELRNKSLGFWAQTFGATAVSWTSRFLVANFILMAFTDMSFHENLIVLSRQLVMWVIMLISPTPGGAGIAEFAFDGFLKDFAPDDNLSWALAIFWRLITYYVYLFIGIIVLPNWIQRVYLKRKLIKFKKQ